VSSPVWTIVTTLKLWADGGNVAWQQPRSLNIAPIL
jgi:hypothetical protein